MISKFASEMNVFMMRSQIYIFPWLIVLVWVWGLNVLNWCIGSKLNVLGIIPRRVRGLPGIIVSPFLHQNFNHLFFNTIPLFVLGLVLLARGMHEFIQVTLAIVVLGGLCVWLFARRARHIGASGLISGYFGYIVLTAYFQPSFTMVIVALLVLYYFGGIFFGIFPREEKVSWESHLYGFLSGLVTAGYLHYSFFKRF